MYICMMLIAITEAELQLVRIKYILVMNKIQKWGYVAFIGALTASAMSACYWQGSKYMISTARWEAIGKQLSKEHPDELSKYETSSGLYPFKYLMVEGTLSHDYQRIERRKENRMGYLIVRALKYKDNSGKQKQIAALQGWCQQQFKYTPKQGLQSAQLFRGILREKQKKDFLHDNFKKQDLQRYKMNTYINLQEVASKLKLDRNEINEKYYLQMLRPLSSTDHESFPYQYSVDNFELPYLTPDKHLSYASFWGCCSLLGLFTIVRVLRFK